MEDILKYIANKETFYLNEGNLLYDSHQYEEAIKKFDKALEINPNYYLAYYNKGISLRNLERHKDAIKEYDRAIKIKPDLALVHYNKARSLSCLGFDEDALHEFNVAIKLDSSDANFYYYKGNLYKKLGKYREALNEYEKAINVNYNDLKTHMSKGNLFHALGEYDDAIKEYDVVISLNSNYANAFNNKGNSLYNLGKHKEAILSYDQAIKIKPDYIDAYKGKGATFHNLGMYVDAIREYNEAIRLDPQDYEIYKNKGVSLRNLGKNEDAIVEFDKALKIKPNDIDSYNNKGNSLFKLGRHVDAMREYDKAIIVNPNDIDAYNNKGVAYDLMGKYDDAINEYDQIIKIKPDNSDAYYNKGVALYHLVRYQDAISEFQKAIKFNPNYANAYNNLGNSFDMLGKYDEAIKVYDKAIKIDPNLQAAIENRNLSFVKLYGKQMSITISESNEMGTKLSYKYNSLQIKQEFDIFKSYSHKDEKKVNPLITMLKHQYNFNVWVDKEQLKPGKDWWIQIENGIQDSKLMLSFVTKSYLASDTCRKELKYAISNNKNFFLVMLEDVSIEDDFEFKPHIQRIQRVQMFRNSNKDIWSGEIFLNLLKSISLITDVSVPVVTVIEKSDLNITDWNNVEELGSGGNAVVYKTHFKGRSVAVKKFYSLFPKGKAFEKGFKNEIEQLGKMKHENIVQLIGYQNNVDTYIVLEYMDGGSLYDYLHIDKYEFNWEKSLNIMKCIIRGLNYLHESHHMKHGDLKSPNILLNNDYTVAKLSDFSMSKIISTISTCNVQVSSIKRSKQTIGTIRWIAPEILAGKDTLKSDIWSFGLVLREIIMGKIPFDTIYDDKVILNKIENNTTEIDVTGVPKKLEILIRCCIERDHEKRVTSNQLLECFSYFKNEQNLH